MPGAVLSIWGLWPYAALLSSAVHPAELLAGAVLAGAVLAGAVLVVAIVAAAGRIGPAVPLDGSGRRRAASVRDRARQARLPRLRDPDAAGRPRPRAPGRLRPAV